jgi:N-methylhydantoinase B
VDPIGTEIFRNRIQAVVEEMAAVVLRTGFTVFIKETADFTAGLMTTKGEVFVATVRVGITLSAGMHGGAVIDAVDIWEKGDVVITNDPFVSRGLVTHLPDLFLLKPIFEGDTLVCFAFAFIHSSDVGGKVPGSVSPSAYDIYQEGLRLRPVKLYRRGRLDRTILQILLDNCRIPEQNWGDLKAMLGSFSVAERRVPELIARYGLTDTLQAFEDLLSYAEARVRSMIRALPVGSYEAWDYLEWDGTSKRPVRIRLRVVVDGDNITLDFTGTDHQVRGSYNLPSAGQNGHYMLVPALVRYFSSRDPSVPYNSGLVRPLKVKAPPGSLVNPDFPAACGVRAATMIRILDCVYQAMAQAVPEEVPAGGAGQGCIVLLAYLNPKTGQRSVGVVNPVSGGSGARPMMDGIDGTDFCVGSLKNVPTEIVEHDMPVIVERYGLRPDSAGAGRYRGGHGIELRLRILAPNTVLTARGLERTRFQPWGLRGGTPGLAGVVVVERVDGRREEMRFLDDLLLQPGDAITFFAPGGGGYGDPRQRLPDDVQRDVDAGLISSENAQKLYGGPPRIPSESQRDATGEPLIVVGDFRARYEAIWTDELQEALLGLLAAYPAEVRSYLRGLLVNEVEERMRRGQKVDDFPAFARGVIADTGLPATIPDPAAPRRLAPDAAPAVT